MKLESHSFAAGTPIPPDFAYGRPAADGTATDGGNRNPHLAWSDVPNGTRSFALLCIDPDVPSRFDDANRAGRRIARDLPRRDFVHWVMVDMPAELREIAAGSCSAGVVAGGKRNPPGPAGARQGRNDYGAGHFGYDGPCPPWNDERLHRYQFRLYALDLATLPVHGAFTAADVQCAIEGHVLAEAALEGTYTLNPGLRGGNV
jgi:hypothetical protein